jgi:hypothetical protein
MASAEEPNFAVGDWVLVRGRLRECMSWDWRIVDVYQVESQGSAPLVGLGQFLVLGQTASQVRAALVEAYRRRTGKRLHSPLSVERVPANLGAYEFFWEAEWSFKAMTRGTCTGEPAPTVPDRDLPTEQDLSRLRSLAWLSRTL